MGDDINLQRALYASFQTARSSGHGSTSYQASAGFRSYRPGPTITRSSSSGATFGRKDALARSGIVPAAKNVGMARASDARRSKGDESTSGTGAAREVAGIPDPPRTAKARANAPGPARARSPVRSKSVRQAVISEITKIQEDQPPDAPGAAIVDDKLREIIENDILDPSAARTTFDDIAALDSAKRVLREAVTLPLLLPDLFTGIREPWRGVLLFGPPGTGKTLLARAVAGSAATFFNCAPSTVASKYRGESEKLVRALFEMARARAPSVVFFDEVDALVSPRGSDGEHEASRRFKAELLTQMDGVASEASADEASGQRPRVVVLAATNHPWDIDEALRRRLERRVYVPMPDKAAREDIFRLHLRGVPTEGSLDLAALAERAAGMSGADIRAVCRDAAMMPVRRLMEGRSTVELVRMREEGKLGNAPISQADLLASLAAARPSVAEKDVQRYEAWAKEFASC